MLFSHTLSLSRSQEPTVEPYTAASKPDLIRIHFASLRFVVGSCFVTHAHTHTHTHTHRHTHARTYARAHTHTHAHIHTGTGRQRMETGMVKCLNVLMCLNVRFICALHAVFALYVE